MKPRDSASGVVPQKFSVTVLRLGHRLVRDERISTHIGLVSRAFGAKKLVLTGADDHTLDSINRLSQSWGGEFEVVYIKNWREFVRNWKGIKVHLTMYGEKLDTGLEKLRRKGAGELLLIIGAEKVPAEIYSSVDHNISVGNQPHSEVAALAVFLDRLFMGEELYNTFSKARLRIKPSLRSKKVEFVNEN
ncbi:MAG TPA: tRNA (cytidine(56)-2'-O)-methyltransferase [Nitrososphaerales archaeon]|nr:tRNA (cytidine(56)-2'-O)-methyltransferase [Nitrososphaerales archaeon]